MSTSTDNITAGVDVNGCYSMFLDSIKSEATKTGYDNSIKRYIGYRKLGNADMLLLEK